MNPQTIKQVPVIKFSKPRVCDICGFVIEDWDDRHEYHDDDCPKFVIDEDGDKRGHVECSCDNVAHPECCPQCNRNTAC